MNAALGRTIQIFLPTGAPRGIRIAELTTRTVQAVLIPQSELLQAKQRPELDQIAVYFLFGEQEEQAKPIVYIGQSEDVRARLDRHNAEKDFWRTAVLGVSKTQAFTPAHIRWLEWYCDRTAKETGRFLLDNVVTPREPFITEPMRADLLDAFDTLSILLTALGYPLFEPVAIAPDQEWFTVKGPDAFGTGTLTVDGFLVKKGSICRRHIMESAGEACSGQRSKLIESGILSERDENQLIFLQDYEFETPSGAAQIVLGRSANGWVEWKDAEGRTLHARKRATDPLS